MISLTGRGWGFALTDGMMTSIKLPWGQRWPWNHSVVAPLLVVSLGMHGLLLFTPFPPPATVEDEEDTAVAEEEAVVDLLSISRLATNSPVVESPPADPVAAPPVAPPSAAALPPAPPPYAEQLPPEALPTEETPSPEATAMGETTPEASSLTGSDPLMSKPLASGFDPNRQSQLVGSAVGVLGRAPGSSNFDLTDEFPGDIWDLYVSRWPEARKQCFFSSIDQGSYTLRPPGADLRYLSRNIQLVEQQDIPRTFTGQVVQPLGPVYCETNLFEIQDQGIPILWVSLVPVSPGGSTTLVLFWSADPRG